MLWRTLRFLALCGLAVLCAGLGGCQTGVGDLFVTKSQQEKQLATLRADYDQRIKVKGDEVAAAKDGIIAGKDAQMVAAAGAFYGSGVVFRSIHTPTRTDLLFNNLAEEGWTALGHVQPSYEATQKLNLRLQKELDETQTSLADLAKSHSDTLVQNQKLSDETKAWQDKLADANAEHARLIGEKQTKLDAVQSDLNSTNDKLIAVEKSSAADRAARQAQLAKLSWGAGILAALCLAGAIWSPVFKQQLGIGAIVLGGAAVAIPFVTGWIILAVAGVALVTLVVWVLQYAHKDERASDALTLAFQDAKDHASAAYSQIAPFVEDRLKRYVKRGGKLVAETDHALQAHLDAKLASYDQLGPVPSQPTPPS